MLFFVALLGENHNLESRVQSYVSSIQNENFKLPCPEVSMQQREAVKLTCEQENFVFVVSLIKYFELTDIKTMELSVERELFWIPYFSSDSIPVSLNLVSEKSSGVNEDSKDNKKLDSLFVVVRKDLSWKVKEVSITDPKLAQIYLEVKESINFNKFVKQAADGYSFNAFELNPESLSLVDKLLLKMQLQKVDELL